MDLFNIFRGKELFLRTLVFILAVVFFFSSWTILGPGTAFIGATIAKGSLVMLGTDLTGNPLRSTLTFLFVFIFIGVMSFLSSLNIYSGLVINFVIIFILAYNFSSSIKQLVWRPFVLGYLYLLLEPGTLNALPSRIIVLAIGALFMTLTQFIVNKNKFKKSTQTGLKNIINEISYKLESLLDNQETASHKGVISSNVSKVVSGIYNKRIDPLFITKTDNIVLNFTLYAERLNYLIDEIHIDLNNPIEKTFIKDLSNLMSNISLLVTKKDSNINFVDTLDYFYDTYKIKLYENYDLYEILQNIEMLKLSVVTSTNNGLKRRDILFNPKLRKSITTAWKFNFSTDSIRFSFGLRISILLSLSFFLVHLFHIEKGNWIVFTIYAILDPLFEDSKKRFSKRFKGTLIGICIFFLIYLTVGNTLIEGAIFIGMYYLYVINKDFSIRTMCTTTVSLGLFAIVSDSPYDAMKYRIIFVILGIIIGYLGNKYLLPYDNNKVRKRITKVYYNHNEEIFEFILKKSLDTHLFRILEEKVFLSKLYESKLISYEDDLIKEFIYNQRILNNTIFFLLFLVQNNSEDINFLNKFSNLMNLNGLTIDNLHQNFNEIHKLVKDEKYFKNEFSKLSTSHEKIIFINLQRILVRLEKSKELQSKIECL